MASEIASEYLGKREQGIQMEQNWPQFVVTEAEWQIQDDTWCVDRYDKILYYLWNFPHQKLEAVMKMLLVFSIKSVSWEGRTSLPPSTQQPGACSTCWGHPTTPVARWPGTGQVQQRSPEPAISESEASFQQSRKQHCIYSVILSEKQKQKLNTEKGKEFTWKG